MLIFQLYYKYYYTSRYFNDNIFIVSKAFKEYIKIHQLHYTINSPIQQRNKQRILLRLRKNDYPMMNDVLQKEGGLDQKKGGKEDDENYMVERKGEKQERVDNFEL